MTDPPGRPESDTRYRALHYSGSALRAHRLQLPHTRPRAVARPRMPELFSAGIYRALPGYSSDVDCAPSTVPFPVPGTTNDARATLCASFEQLRVAARQTRPAA